MEKFEYKTLTTNVKGIWGGNVDLEKYENQLNQLGADGWELVSSVAVAEVQGATRWIISTFKRKI